MKIAIIGTAPSSMHLAPQGDPSFKIWACSPGTYATLGRCDAFFELHRWEPGEIGKPHTQKPWFSPEYVAWMARQHTVWMFDAVPEIPGSRRLPVEDLTAKYGTLFFTSSIAWMIACAIEDILEARANGADEGHSIALYGIDMAATEEYGYQRAGCQHMLLLAAHLGINIIVPPESDLLRPMPLYGIDESTPWMIKLTARNRELQSRLANAQNNHANLTREIAFLQGAIDDNNYHMQTWGGDRQASGVDISILAQSPALRQEVLRTQPVNDALVLDDGLLRSGEPAPTSPKAYTGRTVSSDPATIVYEPELPTHNPEAD